MYVYVCDNHVVMKLKSEFWDFPRRGQPTRHYHNLGLRKQNNLTVFYKADYQPHSELEDNLT